MKPTFISFVVFLVLFSCKNREEKPDLHQLPIQEEEAEPYTSLQTYISEQWHFSVDIPSSYEVAEGELPATTPVINIYDPNIPSVPPLGIHEKAEASYITLLPEGFGVDAPSGTRKSFEEWKGGLPLSFEIDPVNSTVYLLESGEPWAASLRFYSSPPGWKKHGSIFIHFAVLDFKAKCFNGGSNEVISMEVCDPLGGDVVKYYGQVVPESKAALNKVLETLSFTSEGKRKREITDLIQVDQPLPDTEVKSPLTIKGKARGYWYFEAEAPVKLVDQDYKTLARGSLRAKGEWMKEEFVPFEAELFFEPPQSQRGYLVFSRSNASGKPEHDRTYRVPVLFAQK